MNAVLSDALVVVGRAATAYFNLWDRSIAMITKMKRRLNLEMYDCHELADRAIAILCGIVAVGILLFTGAGEVMWGQLVAYVATWGAL